jgi:hypothetical protein
MCYAAAASYKIVIKDKESLAACADSKWRDMNKTIYKLGFWYGLIAFVSTVAFTIVQLLQLLGVLTYPLAEIFIYGNKKRDRQQAISFYFYFKSH